MDRQVTVGVSGGVDSTVSLVLLREQGYTARGVMLRMLTSFDGMSNAADTERARAMCEALGVEFETLDGGKTFRKNVTDVFCEAYRQGRTPNPCVIFLSVSSSIDASLQKEQATACAQLYPLCFFSTAFSHLKFSIYKILLCINFNRIK